MTLHCWERGKMSAGKSLEVNADPSQKGNGVQSNDDKHGMEFNPVHRAPYWEDAPKVIPTEQ